MFWRRESIKVLLKLVQDVLCHVTEEPHEHAPRPCTADHFSPHGLLRDNCAATLFFVNFVKLLFDINIVRNLPVMVINLTCKSKFYFAQLIIAGKSTSALGAEPPLLSYTVVEEWEGLGPTY